MSYNRGNEQLAIRVAEVLNDYRTLQQVIVDSWENPTTAEEQQETGFVVLTHSYQAAQSLLSVQAPPEPSDGASPNTERMQLQTILIDACARRLQSKIIYLRTVAALRNIHAKQTIRAGHRTSDASSVQDADRRLQSELTLISDQNVFDDLRAVDYQAGRYTDQDPSLNQVLASAVPRF